MGKGREKRWCEGQSHDAHVAPRGGQASAREQANGDCAARGRAVEDLGRTGDTPGREGNLPWLDGCADLSEVEGGSGGHAGGDAGLVGTHPRGDQGVGAVLAT